MNMDGSAHHHRDPSISSARSVLPVAEDTVMHEYRTKVVIDNITSSSGTSKRKSKKDKPDGTTTETTRRSSKRSKDRRVAATAPSVGDSEARVSKPSNDDSSEKRSSSSKKTRTKKGENKKTKTKKSSTSRRVPRSDGDQPKQQDPPAEVVRTDSVILDIGLMKQKEDIEQASVARTSATSSIEESFDRSLSLSSCPLIDIEFGSNEEKGNQSNSRNAPPPQHNGSTFDPNILRRRFRSLKKEFMRFKMLKMMQVVLAIYIGICTLGSSGGVRNKETGLVVDPESSERTASGVILVNGTERAIVAATYFQVICLGITRMGAFFMYPALVLVFTSKFRATTSFLTKSPFAMHMYKDSHELHVYCGWTILIFSIIHGTFHTIRWAQQGNLYLFLQNYAGLSGIIMILSCLLICIPMTMFRNQIKYEIRKRLHYLFILFVGALIFHSPASAIPNGGFSPWVFSIILVWYLMDATYCYFFMTEKIETTKFSVVDCGVRMTMTVSDRFQKMGNKGGVCYVCLPFIDKNQWHAFSLFEDPENPAERQIFIQKTGDWTGHVHRVLQRDTVRPAWVHGPFPSPYDNAIAYDNQILVASGIGITPALSVIRAHKDTRRINLVWAVRDEALLEFFLKHLYLDHDGWNLIFYTGNKKIRNQCVHLEADTNICIISGRPDLKELIPNIIYGIESGVGLPESYTPGTKMATSELLANQLLASTETLGLSCTSNDVVEDLVLQASELGFDLSSKAVSQELSITGSRRSRRAAKLCLSDSVRLSASIRGNLLIGFRPWHHHRAASDYVKNLDKNLVLPTWGILYCGGAKPVLDVLEEISDEFDIGLHVESFAW